MKKLLRSILIFTISLTTLAQGEDAKKSDNVEPQSIAKKESVDTLLLRDGSILRGKFIHIKDKEFYFKTEYAGVVKIKQDFVSKLETSGKLQITADDMANITNETTKSVTIVDGQVVVKSDTDDFLVPWGQVKSIWTIEGGDPTIPIVEAPKNPEWKFELAMGIDGKDGNTDRFASRYSFTAQYDTERYKNKFYAQYRNAEQDGARSEDEFKFSYDLERIKHDNWTCYFRTELEKDNIENLDLRWTNAVGTGYYFINDKNQKLRFRAGIQNVYEDYEESSENNMGLDFGLYHEYVFESFNNSKLSTDITYTPTFDDFDDYRVYHITKLDIPVSEDNASWLIQLSYSNDYRSIVPAGRENLDNSYFIKLVRRW